MSVILYKYYNSKIVSEKCEPVNIDELLKSGYATSPDALVKQKKADTNNSGKLSDSEIKEAAKEAGIKIGRKTIATLKKELGL